MLCVINGRCTVLPCPDCCAPLQSLGRKSTHNSRTLLHAGNEVLRERHRQRVEVYFCTVTTTVHVEYFRDLYRAVYDWGWPRLPGREQATSPQSFGKAGEISITPQNSSDSHVHTCAMQRHHGRLASWQLDRCIHGNARGRERERERERER